MSSGEKRKRNNKCTYILRSRLAVTTSALPLFQFACPQGLPATYDAMFATQGPLYGLCNRLLSLPYSIAPDYSSSCLVLIYSLYSCSHSSISCIRRSAMTSASSVSTYLRGHTRFQFRFHPHNLIPMFHKLCRYFLIPFHRFCCFFFMLFSAYFGVVCVYPWWCCCSYHELRLSSGRFRNKSCVDSSGEMNGD